MSIISTVQNILDEKDLNDFIGIKEDFCFEAKGCTPYNFDNANDRYELAKDISAFANSQGGFLVIGLKTEQLIEENTDKISELDLLDEATFNISSYQGIIKENIYPEINGLKIGFVKDKNITDKGVGYVYIPPQNEYKKYFIIKNIIENDERLKNIVFGIIKRNGADNIPLNIKEIYNFLQNGKNEVSTRLSSIEEKIDILSTVSQKKSALIKSSTYDDKEMFEEILKTSPIIKEQYE